MAIPQSPLFASFFPSGKTEEDFRSLGLSRVRLERPKDIDLFRTRASQPGTQENKLANFFGGVNNYIKADDAYNKAYYDYTVDVAKYNVANANMPSDIVDTAEARRDEAGATRVGRDELIQQDKQNRYDTIRNELETQYNNLVSYDSRLAYQGRSGDLNTIFDQQARQLRDAGVSSIANLGVENGQLINRETGNVITNSNLGGQIYKDRDTGVQKWGDIFSGVKGGANYGIQALEDGSVVLFPAWEKTKSPIAQIGLGGLESVIVPLLTIGGAIYGGKAGAEAGYAIAGAAAGAAAGSTTGQLLASGEIDWEQVAKSAATAGAGQYVSGLLSGGEAAADLSGTTGGMTGADYGFQVSSGEGLLGVGDLASADFIAADAAQLYAQTGDIAAVQQNLIGAGVDPIIAAETANLAGLGLNATQIASNLSPSMIGEIYAPSANTLRIEDLAFVGDDAAQLYKQTGSVGATQQNLIAAGVDPIIAAEASNLAALGQAGPNIASNLNQAFPGDTVFTSEGLLSGGSTMDQFAKDIGGNITSTAGASAGLGTAGDLLKAGASLVGGQPQPQPQPYQSGYGAGRQMAGVDASGLLALLQGRAGVPGVTGLLAPVVNPYSLLG